MAVRYKQPTALPFPPIPVPPPPGVIPKPLWDPFQRPGLTATRYLQPRTVAALRRTLLANGVR